MTRNILVLMVALLACRVSGYGEVDQNGHPTWEERANHLFVNAVRMDPTYYKNNLWNGYSPAPGSTTLVNYPAVNPVYLANGLIRSAYNHSLDMGTFPCFQHATCGSNQDTFVRVKQFYNCGTLGENIAAGVSTPLGTNNQWLCDSTNGVCADDKSANDGHRSNIMSSSYKTIGVGYAYVSSATYKHYWTQDFGNCLTLGDGTYSSSIYGGSHYVLGSNTKFSAAWFDSAAPSSAVVVIGGTSSSLSLEMGSSTRGIYTFSTASVSVGTQYYFQLGSYRFPDTGFLVVVGTGYTSSWVGGSSTTAAPTVAATTVKPTTVAPTTVAPTTVTPTTIPPTTTAAPTTVATTAAPTTRATTAAPTTVATTAAPTTVATTAAPTTVATTAAPTTVATTAAPTTRAPTTAAPTTTRAPTTAAPTTTRAPTTAAPTTTRPPTTASPTTTRPNGYFLFANALLNSWTTYQNSGQAAITTAVFLGQTALKITLGPSSANNKFFWLAHSTTVDSSLYTSLSFNIAASSSQDIVYYFNGEYTQTAKSVPSTSYKQVTTQLKYASNQGMLAPGHTALGSSGHELIFQNGASSAVTIYLYNVQFI